MKRSAALSALSREHHTALVLALRIAQATDQARIEAIRQAIPRIFQEQLEPHFQTEEQTLLPRLDAGGGAELAERTRQEHGELRHLATRIASGESAAIKAFGSLLAAHVRFEERELFTFAENILAGEACGTVTARPAPMP